MERRVTPSKRASLRTGDQRPVHRLKRVISPGPNSNQALGSAGEHVPTKVRLVLRNAFIIVYVNKKAH